jgi:hypothetical protein
MGMDIIGSHPTNTCGEYFRASVWAWHPIVSLMSTTCSDFLSDKFFEDISYNAGLGATAKESKVISTRLVQYMEHHISGKRLKAETTPPSAAAVAKLINKVQPPTSLCSSEYEFYVSDATLRRWVDFLQNCGGFTVH